MVSVIIATRNRSEILKYCIDSLLKQDASTDLYEIIVADNDSTDDTKKMVDEFKKNGQTLPQIFGYNEKAFEGKT